jgi:hypothetical protein
MTQLAFHKAEKELRVFSGKFGNRLYFGLDASEIFTPDHCRRLAAGVAT